MKSQILDAFFEGQAINAYETLGAHLRFEQVQGVRFSVYAPFAQSVQVIGSFNNWSCLDYRMEKIDQRGIWSVFIPHVKEGDMYKYRITQCSGDVVDKADPYAFYSELRPNTASIVSDISYSWDDNAWMESRNRRFHQPLNIYELYLGSWMKSDKVSYKEVAPKLIAYLQDMHYTHVEFMPLNEYPFDGSWGYQASGYYSATSRYGSIQDLKCLINELHNAKIGVIFDFVPVHFVMDDFSLRCFDGTNLYEYEHDTVGKSEWGTANFDLSKEEVRSFLMSAAAYWIKEFHGDGLRMDAISNVIYWQGDKGRGVNEEGITFIKRMNYLLHQKFHEVIMIAEDSSDYKGVTKDTLNDGLGFDYKWDLGWMNDTLNYFKIDPIYRREEHHKLTFSMAYFYQENFILPFSHDEVVHGKATIVNKMWGSYEQKFSQARLLYMYMYMHPGKKLNFMGNEIGMIREFDEDVENDWFLLKYPMHDSFQQYVKKLNELYQKEETLFEDDFNLETFEWIDADNKNENLYSFMRKNKKEILIGIFNMSPNTYRKHKFGVLEDGEYVEILNSEKNIYSGCGIINEGVIIAKQETSNYNPYTIEVDVAPFAGIMIKHKRKKAEDFYE